MRCPATRADEPERLQALAAYGLGNDAIPNLDPIVSVAAKLFDCPVAAVNIVGQDKVFITSGYGIDAYDNRRDVSFCAHAIQQHQVMVVEDATLDPRFHDNPIVEAGAIRFYAGVPLLAASGHALGALCVIDTKPRGGFDKEEQARLKELAVLVQDQLELRRLQLGATSQAARFMASAATSPNAFICFDPQLRITECNAAAAAMFGTPADTLPGRSIYDLVARDGWEIVKAGVERVLNGGEPNAAGRELTGLRASGEPFPAEIHWSCWREDEGLHFGAIVRDITQSKRDQAALYRLANYDTLTGLPNRNLLQERVAEAFARSAGVALIVTDLHGFSDVNNTLGHEVGDAVLRVVAERLQRIAAGTGLVARTGSDDFTLMITDPADPAAVDATARAICDAIAEPIVCEGKEVRVAGSCGIALAPEHGETFPDLLGSARLALLHARTLGRSAVFVFTPALRSEAVARRMYEAELHRAFERREFDVFYQPQMRLADDRLVSAEALIRWRHPVRGLLAPSAFLPALDASVLADPVGTWVLETACEQALAWRRHIPEFSVSVNLFAAQLRTGSLPHVVLGVLERCGLPPEALELEITENIMLAEQGEVLRQLQALREMGIKLSFDDFGTGYASLNLLRDFPVTHIKIDKSFTKVLQSSPKDQAIVESLVDLAQRLGLGVIVEGIEKAWDRSFVGRLGCEKGQGYYFGRPVPPALFQEQFLAPTVATA